MQTVEFKEEWMKEHLVTRTKPRESEALNHKLHQTQSSKEKEFCLQRLPIQILKPMRESCKMKCRQENQQLTETTAECDTLT